MSLSEDIRLGALLYPQSDQWYRYDAKRRVEACCAMGGAWLAAGQASDQIYAARFPSYWSITALLSTCPECDEVDNVGRIIWWHLGMNPDWDRCLGLKKDLPRYSERLKEGKRWTREQIADWVESIEQQEVPVLILVDEAKKNMLVSVS